ncbi:MAG: alpha-hydroxy acid oxidase [Acidobacteriaceae bacterium]
MNMTAVAPVCLDDFEALAQTREHVSEMTWEYVRGGSADENTMRWNREAFARLRLKPKVLVDVSHIDTRVTLFGEEHASPLLLAPTAYHKLLHPEGEIATARGAALGGAAMVVSSFSNISIEDIAKTAKCPLWFQLYAQSDRGFTRELALRAEAAGCRALCLTVDTPVLGCRNREDRVGFALPPGTARANLNALKFAGVEIGNLLTAHRTVDEHSIYTAMLDASLNWKDLDWLRSLSKLPLLLKGVLNPEDAARAVEAGVSGIIVSNHGGRNLDTVPATIDALPFIAEKVAGRIPVLMDGGIRRGTDVLKAIALGADAVLIGRPQLYGLACGGAEGVARVIEILRRELEMAMALCGRTTIASIDRGALWE